MARQDYMTIAVQRSVQEIFRKFIEVKEVTVKEALSDMLEMYMLATDAELYMELKKENLNIEDVRNMVLDMNSEVSKNNCLFMKLGFSTTNDNKELGGHDTIVAYLKNCNNNGYTWYSTNSLKSGMSDEKVIKYNELAKTGRLKIYYAMNQDEIDNDIAYVAEVDEILSYSQPTKAPCEDYEYPEEWTGCKNNIWIKIHDLKKENTVTAEDFVVISTGNGLKDVIRKGQYIFGYIRRRLT